MATPNLRLAASDL
jgi:hypothetical protein